MPLPGLASGMLQSPVEGGSSSGVGSGSLLASVSPTSVSKTSSTRGSDKTVTAGPATVTVSGGSGGYTYSWARIAGDSSITAGAPSAASTSFSALLSPDDSVTATFECTVTDAAGSVTRLQVGVSLTLVFIDIGSTL